MRRNLPVEYEEHEVVDGCRRAAWRLRFRPGGVTSENAKFDSLVSDLLDAVGTAVATRPVSVPEGVQRAALRVAQHLRASRERDVRGGHDGHGVARGRHTEIRSDSDQECVSDPDVPFAPSIRLGRLG